MNVIVHFRTLEPRVIVLPLYQKARAYLQNHDSMPGRVEYQEIEYTNTHIGNWCYSGCMTSYTYNIVFVHEWCSFFRHVHNIPIKPSSL